MEYLDKAKKLKHDPSILIYSREMILLNFADNEGIDHFEVGKDEEDLEKFNRKTVRVGDYYFEV